jgi:hypothetical protein
MYRGRNVLVLMCVCAAIVLSIAPEIVRAETIAYGTVYRTGSDSNGFPEFLNTAYTNATTKAWNLDGSTVSLNNISVVGVGAGGNSDITFTGTGLDHYEHTYYKSIGTGPWVGDPQAAAKAAIADTGLYNTSSWTAHIAVTANKMYTVELLSNPTRQHALSRAVGERRGNHVCHGHSRAHRRAFDGVSLPSNAHGQSP